MHKTPPTTSTILFVIVCACAPSVSLTFVTSILAPETGLFGSVFSGQAATHEGEMPTISDKNEIKFLKPDKIAQWTIKVLAYCTCENGYTKTNPSHSCSHAYLPSFFLFTALTSLSLDYILLARC